MKVLLAILLLPMLPQRLQAQQWLLHEKHGNWEFFSEVPLPLERLKNELRGVESEVNELIQLPETQQNVQIIIFRSPANYRAHLSRQIPEALNRRAIFYKNGSHSAIYAVHHPALFTDLRHEFTHALLHQTLPFIPLWIDEGLAEYFEETPTQRVHSKRLSSVRWKSRTGWSPSLRQLEKLPSAASMNSGDYRDSWACVHYLLNGSGRTRELFRNYLSAISAGEAPGMFSEWVLHHDTEVINRMGSYFRRIRFSLRSRPRR